MSDRQDIATTVDRDDDGLFLRLSAIDVNTGHVTWLRIRPTPRQAWRLAWQLITT